jgi:hypothetical protein
MFIPDLNFSILDPESSVKKIPDPASKRFRVSDPDPHQRIQVFLTLKTVSKLSENLSGMFILDPVFPSRIQGQKSTRFRIRIRTTVVYM